MTPSQYFHVVNKRTSVVTKQRRQWEDQDLRLRLRQNHLQYFFRVQNPK